jgi:hypothetical protein
MGDNNFGPADQEEDDVNSSYNKSLSLRENGGSGLVNTRISDRESEVDDINK